MEDQIKKELSAIVNGHAAFDQSMGSFTTLRVGGPCWAVVTPESMGELKTMLQFLIYHKIPYEVIGKGSNILVSDTGYKGVLIDLEKGFSNIDFIDQERDRVAKAGAGASLQELVKKCARLGYKGLEFAAGIPGTVGGAIRMNAGAFNGQVEQVLRSVEVMTKEGGYVEKNREELRFDYRYLELDKGSVILSGSFSVGFSSPENISRRIQEILLRRSSQPKAWGRAGSIFKNPPGDSAGRLIDQAGFKGFSIGEARVAQEHANWIVTSEGATASDVYLVLKSIQKGVLDKLGIRLEPEIIFWGFDEQ